MSKKQRTISLIVFVATLVLLLVGIFLTGNTVGEKEPLKEVIKDAVLHENDKVDLFGMQVNPGLISAFTVTGIMLVFAVIVRIFVIPKFTMIPGKFQLLLEQAVGLFDNMAKANSEHRNKFLGAYIFSAGAYIFIGTLFELVGVQVVSVNGHSVSLPAPLADINGAIAMGCLSYGVILFGGLIGNGFKGFFSALKDFSLPLSMSFRLFGALLSGAIVTELVYYTISLSIVLPVIVGVVFTLIHALVQAYVLTTLVALFYGESNEPSKPKPKKAKKEKTKKVTA